MYRLVSNENTSKNTNPNIPKMIHQLDVFFRRSQVKNEEQIDNFQIAQQILMTLIGTYEQVRIEYDKQIQEAQKRIKELETILSKHNITIEIPKEETKPTQ